MSAITFPDSLVSPGGGGRIVLLVLDGLGGLPHPETGRTELETAATPVMDALASRSSLGMLIPVEYGVTPGSGPGHLGLFGYDPARFVIGRGVLSALGVGFELQPGDVAARLNLASLDLEGRVTDRRAGRPSDEVGRGLIAQVEAALKPIPGVEVFLRHVKEHRAVVILRGEGLEEGVEDTDPQHTGVPPLRARAEHPGAARTADVLQGFLDQAAGILAEAGSSIGFLARGTACYEAPPSFRERFGLQAAVVARYPMYRGVARLVGMDVPGVPSSDDEAMALMEAVAGEYDFTFVHYKATDARGEDGDFDAKVAAIEAADLQVQRILDTGPDVLLITGDHATPANMASHSWHPVPLMIHGPHVRPTASTFGEATCRAGDLGVMPSRHLMSMALAHAGRLEKFGA